MKHRSSITLPAEPDGSPGYCRGSLEPSFLGTRKGSSMPTSAPSIAAWSNSSPFEIVRTLPSDWVFQRLPVTAQDCYHATRSAKLKAVEVTVWAIRIPRSRLNTSKLS